MTTITHDVERFLSFLDSETEVFCYALFNEDSSEVLKGCGVIFGTAQEILDNINLHADKGESFTLHITLCSTNLKGRRRENIERARVLCVDLDSPTSREDLKSLIEEPLAADSIVQSTKFSPHLVVCSSPDKYHLYWKCNLSLDEWERAQLGLAAKYGGDRSLAARTHIIRVPGVSRVTKEGEEFMPYIAYHCDDEHVDYEWLSRAGIWELSEKAIEQQTKERKALRSKVREVSGSVTLSGGIAAAEYGTLARAESRNITLYSVIRELVRRSAAEPDYESAMGAAAEFNRRLAAEHAKGALSEREVRTTTESAWKNGLKARERYLEWRETQEKRAATVLSAVQFERVEIENGAGENPEIQMNGNGAVHANGDESGYGKYRYSQENFQYDYSRDNLALDPFTDAALVDRVLQRFGNKLIRVGNPKNGPIFAFDEKRMTWNAERKECPTAIRGMVDRCIYDTIADPGFVERFAKTKDGVSVEKLNQAIGRWKSCGRISMATAGVFAHEKIQSQGVWPFDRNALLFHCSNGVLDLETGEFRRAAARDMLLGQSRAEYRPEVGVSAWWKEFVSQVFAENDKPEAMAQFLKEVFGYTLTGSMHEQVVFIHYGDGANGKSRVLAALASLLGDYAARLTPDSLGKGKTGTPRALERIGAKTEGKRFVMIDDLDTGVVWNEGLVKGLTDKKITARKLYEEERDIPNAAKVHIGCNQIPKVESSSHAVYRRMAIIEYSRRFPVNPAKFIEIEQGIERELSGILNWALEGLKDVQQRADKRIQYPEEVISRVEDYERSNSGLELEILRFVEVLADGPEMADEQHWLEGSEVLDFILKRSGGHGRLVAEAGTLEDVGRLLTRVGAAKRRQWRNGKRGRPTVYRVRLRREEEFGTVF